MSSSDLAFRLVYGVEALSTVPDRGINLLSSVLDFQIVGGIEVFSSVLCS